MIPDYEGPMIDRNTKELIKILKRIKSELGDETEILYVGGIIFALENEDESRTEEIKSFLKILLAQSGKEYLEG
jgi:hypothetical protein